MDVVGISYGVGARGKAVMSGLGGSMLGLLCVAASMVSDKFEILVARHSIDLKTGAKVSLSQLVVGSLWHVVGLFFLESGLFNGVGGDEGGRIIMVINVIGDSIS